MRSCAPGRKEVWAGRKDMEEENGGMKAAISSLFLLKCATVIYGKKCIYPVF